MQLLQEDQPVTENDYFFALVKSVNYLAREYGLTRPSRGFNNKSSIFLDHR